MANDDNTDKLGQWRIESAGLHMRSDATDAGKLVRLADVVLWLIEAKELPRVEAVEALCSALESAPTVPDLFCARAGQRAELLEGDAALFGFHTVETWAVKELARERLNDMHRNPGYYDFRDRERPWIDNGPPSELSAASMDAIRAEVRNGGRPMVTAIGERAQYLCEPGIPAAVRYIRERWPTPPRRRMDGTTALDALDYAGGLAFGLSVRERDAHALWGWGVEQADATVEAAELTTYADLVRHRRANPLANWDVPANQRALLRAEVDRAESAGESRPRTRIGVELDVSKTRIGQVLSRSPGMRATARAKRASNVKPLDVHRKAS